MPDDLLKKARFHWIVKSRETIKLATVARDLHVDGHVELELEGNKLNRFVIGSRKTNKVHCVAQGLFFISNFTRMKYLSISCNVLNVYYSRMIKLFNISSRSSESLQSDRIFYVWIVQ